MSGAPRPRPDPGHHPRRATATARSPALKVELLADMGAYLGPGHARACRSSARSCSTRSTSSRPTGSSAPTSSPTRRRPTPTAAPAARRRRSRSSGSWTSSPSSSAWTRWSCARRTGSSTRSSRSPRSRGLTYDSGNYEAATAKAHGAVRLRRAARASSSERRESGDPVQLGIGISTFTEMCGLAPSRVLGSLAYGAGGWEHAAIRMLPTGKVEVVTGTVAARPGPRDGVEPDRRRPARACRSRTSRCCTATPRSRTRGWTPTARGRWPSAASRSSRPRDKVIAKARQGRRAPAGGRRGRPRVRRRQVHACGAPTRQRSDPGDRARGVRRARLAGRHRADARLRRHVRPGELLVPARHAPVRDRGRHRDRAGQRSAPTSASTTSARWSTR